jgi:phospholipid/cholesterol/gamma-HCH transport system ATP-binding protein
MRRRAIFVLSGSLCTGGNAPITIAIAIFVEGPPGHRLCHTGTMAGDSESKFLQGQIEDNAYIRFVDVWKSFGDQPVLENVSFEVRRGEMVAVLGRSGVGKSVTLKHILGFLRPDRGEVYVAGRNIDHATEAELTEMRRYVTMVFQSGALFDSMTVGENVAYPLRERALRDPNLQDEDRIQDQVDMLLSLVELGEMKDLMPSDLSTGMKRSVAIARALAAAPEAILYDEPTTMVDPLMAQTLGDLILKLKRQKGLTSVVVTHDMKLARKLADRVVFLVEGRVAFFGPMKELDSSPEPVIQEFIQLDEISMLT